MPECCVCYTDADSVDFYNCTHAVCSECMVGMIRNGRHHTCPMCRGPCKRSFTIGISTTDDAVLYDDEDGSGIIITQNSLFEFTGCWTAEGLNEVTGTRQATVARLLDDIILYGTNAVTTADVLDCFFTVPHAASTTRAARALRRSLPPLSMTMIDGSIWPLQSVLTRLVFPVFVVDLSEPPDYETTDDLPFLEH